MTVMQLRSINYFGILSAVPFHLIQRMMLAHVRRKWEGRYVSLAQASRPLKCETVVWRGINNRTITLRVNYYDLNIPGSGRPESSSPPSTASSSICSSSLSASSISLQHLPCRQKESLPRNKPYVIEFHVNWIFLFHDICRQVHHPRIQLSRFCHH